MEPTITYRKIELKDKDNITRAYAQDPQRTCEHCFANNYLWQKAYPTEIAFFDGCISIRFWDGGDLYYDFPAGGGDKEAAMKRIVSWTRRQTHFRFYGLLQEEVAQLEKWFPNAFTILPDRAMYDYIYETEKLIQLPGKKLHGKRNHIRRFMDHPCWHYERLDSQNQIDCQKMNHIWKRKRADKWDAEMEQEYQIVNQALQQHETLGMIGGVLYLDDQVVAFTMGESLGGDTFVVHFEKAFPDIQGAYPMINQQFVSHECQNFRYINREDDAGDEGLRKAKLSYQPDILLEKYLAIRK